MRSQLFLPERQLVATWNSDVVYDISQEDSISFIASYAMAWTRKRDVIRQEHSLTYERWYLSHPEPQSGRRRKVKPTLCGEELSPKTHSFLLPSFFSDDKDE